MTNTKRAYLLRIIVRSHNTLTNPTIIDKQHRRAARCTINLAARRLRQLGPIPPMKRRLDTDKRRRLAA